MWSALLVAVAFAGPSTGLDRWFVDPETLAARLGPGAETLRLQSPHRSRSVLEVDGIALGEVLPRAEVAIVGVAERPRAICWITPHGLRRCPATAPTPAR